MPVVSVDVDEVRRQIGEGAFPELETQSDEVLRCDEGLAHKIRELIVGQAHEAGLPAYARPQRILLLPEPLHEDKGTLTKGLKKIVPGAVAEQYRALIEAAYE